MSWTPLGSVRGPAGPPGTGGAYVHHQTAPAGTWTAVHGFERIPHSVVFLVDGQQVFTDYTADETYVVAEFPSPTTGEIHIL
jgi:hypothetical protein